VSQLAQITRHVTAVRACQACPRMIAPAVTGNPVVSKVMLIGQAPGIKEGPAQKPFAWTAGKTLFGWFERIGVAEAAFRERVYMAAVCRCFPGKNPKGGGGDRVPDGEEIERCSAFLAAEVKILQPQLVVPVGKLAIAQLLPDLDQLVDSVGQRHRVRWHGHLTDVIPLPHPSGASTWHRMEPGKALLETALRDLAGHPAWRHIVTAVTATEAS
jgi:uracil-DNA glycosylase